ncbi:hypothetical protein B0H14DRAFT_3458087 [Mycena olivaceomarginata]|nr:hypothetical protein B0H14DRAFT_3458087 [Mycena olivaceomarginata]
MQQHLHLHSQYHYNFDYDVAHAPTPAPVPATTTALTMGTREAPLTRMLIREDVFGPLGALGVVWWAMDVAIVWHVEQLLYTLNLNLPEPSPVLVHVEIERNAHGHVGFLSLPPTPPSLLSPLITLSTGAPAYTHLDNTYLHHRRGLSSSGLAGIGTGGAAISLGAWAGVSLPQRTDAYHRRRLRARWRDDDASRCLEVATGPDERRKNVACMRGHIVNFATNCYGCHDLQKALDCEEE